MAFYGCIWRREKPHSQRQRLLDSSVVFIPWFVDRKLPLIFFSWLWNQWFLILRSCPLSGTLILWNSRLPSLFCFCLVKRLCHLSDVDECETSVCAEECLNTLGSFRCFCDGRQGMKLSQDLRSCKVKYMNCGKCSTNHRFHISPSECGYMWTVICMSVTLLKLLHFLFLVFFLSVCLQPLTPCISPSLKRNSRSLYLGRMFSGVPVVRLRFRRKIQTGWESEFGAVATFSL